jgi:hypothetical protein
MKTLFTLYKLICRELLVLARYGVSKSFNTQSHVRYEKRIEEHLPNFSSSLKVFTHFTVETIDA